ncbi:MAG: cation acetate symporter [Solirubrobacterales bacterium]|nr:cation acetate symporter [Solirubrobacterales bacterium]
MIIPIFAVGAITIATIGIGTWGVRYARTTSDLYVASRAMSPWWNAAAISGEYLSAASFLGIAGLMMQIGVPALWQAVGFAAGYLALLLFVAAPLRRFGSYTLPDFAEGRFASRELRNLAVAAVLAIDTFYLIPQLKGAGIAFTEVAGAPYGTGIAVVAVVVTLYVALGGMRGVTYVQAFQFWVKTVAIAIPAIALLIYLGGLPHRATLFGDRVPRAPAHGLVVNLDHRQTVTFPVATTFEANGRVQNARAGQSLVLAPGRIMLPPNAVVPVSPGTPWQTGRQWARPVRSQGEGAPLFIYSLLLATFLGTMGLPHILIRFYTNPDGPTARRTTVWVLALLALFYLFPPIYGALGRALAPSLYLTGETDTVVLQLPTLAWQGIGGQILGAMTAAGAFAAFMSTSSGLLISIAGTISYDVWGRGGRTVRLAVRRRRFRLVAALGMAIPSAVALAVRSVDISILVGWAFALAASTFCPLFVLGIWWPRLTPRGAGMGIAAGGVIAIGAITAGVIAGTQTLNGPLDSILTQPAIVSVPLAFATMILGSITTQDSPDAGPQMLGLHSPEGLGLEAVDRARA